MKKLNLKEKIVFCFLIALLIVFCFTPLGSIPIGLVTATLSMIPVIITSLMYGMIYGMIMGGLFATFSFIYWTFIMPAYVTAFLFSPFASFANYHGNFYSLIICFVPRILSGLVPAIIGFKDAENANSFIYDKRKIFASVFGSLTNTIFVLLFIFLFFGNEYKEIAGKAIFGVLSATVLTNGIPEALVCAVICPPLVKMGKKFLLV